MPVGYPSLYQLPINENFLVESDAYQCVTLTFPSTMTASINENQAQKGTYFIIFLGASSSKGLIFPSSTASRIYRESAALFLSSAPNRFLSEALVKQ